jgi:GNAT superfamily N-acetyltransferase
MNVLQVHQLPELTDLASASRREGFRFVDRLIKGFENEENPFDKAGEALFAVFDQGKCVGIGGVNIDPAGSAHIGRVRRVYVTPSHRGRGVGRLLMEYIEDWSCNHFAMLQLFTDTSEASDFYETLGYKRVMEDKVSHVKALAT